MGIFLGKWLLEAQEFLELSSLPIKQGIWKIMHQYKQASFSVFNLCKIYRYLKLI